MNKWSVIISIIGLIETFSCSRMNFIVFVGVV